MLGNRQDPVAAASAFVDEHFPAALAAFAGGSVMRGEGTATSDIDLMLVVSQPEAPYRESFVAFGWPIEAFVHSLESYKRYFAEDATRRRPTLPTICVEGAILRDVDGLAQQIRVDAQELLAKGPAPLTAAEVDFARYMISDLLDDLAGSRNPDESLFIASQIANETADFLLAYNQRWSGKGKWLMRALRCFEPNAANNLAAALRIFYQTNSPDQLVQFADAALAPAGGRLFAGYSSAGKKANE